jgi:redox-sensitive bicupin YhaK (pirin superfamily)
MGNFKAGETAQYTFKREGNGLYVFVIKGALTVDGQALELRDGMGIWTDDNSLATVDFQMTEDTELLLMEVPMFQ